ncbi:RepB family plasmid replication initiator protein [Photobacterium phosphoreum]|uniref:RepB family plasmid replication initiator protein n=1 Tax=Photobacterium phosphoreum TaxID=659 RepID=A0AAW4ZVU2_PHOPO|nr:replication initiation protein [Photobacterium phosphoreum]MCD9492633.1 RepB family plasmid replication initiator protein [Photobacterium phosphoreum]MCF2191802.1 RepB family plasmid replication initiator protein [Photobacterium phosphoreum]MCF2303464.1 RepB family plasmid replication initiator protein [Photobacterium phosphoreum]
MMNNAEVVVKPHSIITARMDLSPREQDLLTLIMLSVKKEYDKLQFAIENDDSVNVELIPQKYTFSKSELITIFEVDESLFRKKDKQTKTHLLDVACKSLWDRGIEIRNGNSFILTRLISFASYDGKTLIMEIPSIMVEELVNYSKGGMGIIDYKLLFKLKGKYDKRILEIISRFKNKRDFSCTIEELCEMVGTKFDSYSSWRSFSGSVLIVPLKSIVRESKGIWDYKDSKRKGYEIKKKTAGKSFTKDDVIIFKMKYCEDPKGLDLLKEKYNSVLNGSLSSKDELLTLLDDLSKSDLLNKSNNPEFIKMWAACMASAK